MNGTELIIIGIVLSVLIDWVSDSMGWNRVGKRLTICSILTISFVMNVSNLYV